MEINKKKCSLETHSEKEAIIYCKFCSIYMCKKCEINHSELFKNHNIIQLNNNTNEIFDDFCQEENHKTKLIYYCKTHKILCCPLCISKIKTKNDGKHADCEINLIENMEKDFKEKINNLENKNKIFSDILKEMENMIDKITDKKEKVKKTVLKIFTEIRNALNNREDEIYEEIDKRFNGYYYNENIINENKIINNEIKAYLDKIKKINIITNINELDILNKNIDNIENKIKDLSTLKEKGNKNNIEMEFKPGLVGVGNMLKKIRNFGDIYINENNDLKIIKCFKSINEDNNILLISNQKYPMINNLLRLNKKINNITIFSPDFIIPKLTYQNINEYKIIIYDLSDGGYGIKTNINEDIKQYLENGGNIIITHDHWTLQNPQGDYAPLLNAKLIPHKYVIVGKAKILNNNHPIFKSYYNLNLQNNSEIDIAQTHKTDTEYNNNEEYLKDLLIELNDGYK